MRIEVPILYIRICLINRSKQYYIEDHDTIKIDIDTLIRQNHNLNGDKLEDKSKSRIGKGNIFK